MMYLAFYHKNLMKYLRLTEPFGAEIHQVLGYNLEDDNIVERRKVNNDQNDSDNSFEISLVDAVKNGNFYLDKYEQNQQGMARDSGNRSQFTHL